MMLYSFFLLLVSIYCSLYIAVNNRIPLDALYCQGVKISKIIGMRTRLRVKEVANRKGISLTKLSQRSEVAYNTVRRIWREPYTDVTLSTLTRLAEVLGVPTSELIEDVPD